MVNSKLNKLLKNDLLYVCLIYVIGVILYAVLGNFSKTAIAIYNDEFFYWDMARNIFHGKGPVITGVDTTFDKAAYSVLIAPFFAITDVVLRVRVLGVFNCMVMMSSLFPLWLLAKKLDLKRSSMLCLLCVTALSSDMLLTMTFMSEILYWPLFIWFICLWFINVKEPRIVYSVIEGILCCIGYRCKEIFICVFIACIAIELCFPVLTFILDGKKERGRLKTYFDKKIMLNSFVFVFSYIVCQTVISMLFFQNRISSYDVRDILPAFEPYTVAYLIYGFVYYIAAVFIGLFVLPVVLPIIQFKAMSKEKRKLFCFITGFIIVLIAVISYTITVREDFGKIIPRLHFRYLAPAFPVIFGIFLTCIEEKHEDIKINRLASWIFLVGTIIISGFIFKGLTTRGSLADQMTMQWHLKLKQKVGALSIGDSSNVTIYTYAILATIIVMLFATTLYWLLNKKKSIIARNIWFIGMIVLCIANTSWKYTEILYRNLNVDEELVKEAANLSYFFKAQEDECQILYLNGENKMGKKVMTRAIDTYLELNKKSNLYKFRSMPLRSAEKEQDYFPIISDYLWENTGQKMESIDYIIVNNDEDWKSVRLLDVDMVPEISGKYYTVYKNTDNHTLLVEPDEARFYHGSKLDIVFYGMDYNADIFVESSLNSKEDGFSWADNRLQVRVPVQGEYGSAVVRCDFTATFNGKQSYIVRQNNEVLEEGTMNGAERIIFIAPIEENQLRFEIEFPDAKEIALAPDEEGFIKNIDYRVASCALSNIIIDSLENYVFSEKDFEILFYGDDYNADFYVKSGLSYKEDNFTWTSGHRMQVRVPVTGDYKNLQVTLNVAQTLNGEQSYIVRQGNTELSSGAVSGKSEITFHAPVKNNYLTFEIEFPDAKAASAEISGSKDGRILACALQNMIINKETGYSGESLSIKFSGDDYNADQYVKAGISYKEEGFSWTSGRQMQVSIPVNGDYDKLMVRLRVGEPFHTKQSYIVRQGKTELCEGVIEKSGEISFAAPVSDGWLSFEIEFPDARVVNEVIPESSDERMVACRLLEMIIESN